MVSVGHFAKSVIFENSKLIIEQQIYNASEQIYKHIGNRISPVVPEKVHVSISTHSNQQVFSRE